MNHNILYGIITAVVAVVIISCFIVVVTTQNVYEYDGEGGLGSYFMKSFFGKWLFQASNTVTSPLCADTRNVIGYGGDCAYYTRVGNEILSPGSIPFRSIPNKECGNCMFCDDTNFRIVDNKYYYAKCSYKDYYFPWEHPKFCDNNCLNIYPIKDIGAYCLRKQSTNPYVLQDPTCVSGKCVSDANCPPCYTCALQSPGIKKCVKLVAPIDSAFIDDKVVHIGFGKGVGCSGKFFNGVDTSVFPDCNFGYKFSCSDGKCQGSQSKTRVGDECHYNEGADDCGVCLKCVQYLENGKQVQKCQPRNDVDPRCNGKINKCKQDTSGTFKCVVGTTGLTVECKAG